jgi:hypothetical protein
MKQERKKREMKRKTAERQGQTKTETEESDELGRERHTKIDRRER